MDLIRRAILYHVLSGHAFFSGGVAMIVAVGLSARSERLGMRIARNLLAASGGVLMLASATPLPRGLVLILTFSAILWVAGEVTHRRISTRWRLGARGNLVLMVLVAMVVEGPYHRTPRLPGLGAPVLGIIGDSLTAGNSAPGGVTWPMILADQQGIEVRDHSASGATVASAARQAEAIGPQERLVLIEIGGNDLLGDTAPEAFEEDLDRLLSIVQRPGRVVLMFELPWPPGHAEYGRIQRRLARQQGVLLVPRRVLLGVLLESGATTDSIHLSPAGHRRMARDIWKIIAPAFP
ncbi:hypothetical protein BH23PLA1_BH23PLA1_25880 [soil metagenome]